jgi:hypothetical protein
MRYRGALKPLACAGFFYACLLPPVFTIAQESTVGAGDSISHFAMQRFPELPLMSGSQPAVDSPFVLQDRGASAVGTPDALFSLNLQHERLNGAIGVLYSPPPGEYLPRPGAAITDGWQNSVAGELSFDLEHGGSVSMEFNADVEIYGSEQQPLDRKQASAQDSKFEWGLAKQFPANNIVKYSMGLEIGGFHEWTITQPLLAGGPLIVREPSYTLFSAGLQTAFTVPDKDMTFTVRYGFDRLMQEPQKHRALAIELSWNW